MATEVQTTTLETIKASSLTEATSISDSNYVVITDNSVSKKAKATLFKGLKGDSGREIEITKDTSYIKWRYVGETSWNNLVALSELKGDKGDSGTSVDLSSYATQAWVTEQIANIQGGGSIDLSSYYTKTEIDNKLTTINADTVDGYHFQVLTQAEYDALTEKDANTFYAISDEDKTGGSGLTSEQSANIAKIPTMEQDIASNKSSLDTITARVDGLELGGNLVLRDVVAGEIFTLDSSTIPTVTYGNIIISKTSTTLTEGGTDSFTVSLDKAPTNNQVVTLSVDNTDVTLDKYSLTFTSSNYNTAQTVTINVKEDDADYSNEICTITLSSPNIAIKTLLVNITDNDTDNSGTEEEIPGGYIYSVKNETLIGDTKATGVNATTGNRTYIFRISDITQKGIIIGKEYAVGLGIKDDNTRMYYSFFPDGGLFKIELCMFETNVTYKLTVSEKDVGNIVHLKLYKNGILQTGDLAQCRYGTSTDELFLSTDCISYDNLPACLGVLDIMYIYNSIV